MKYNFEWFQFLFFQKVYEFIQTCSLHFLPEFDLNLYDDKIVQIAKVILNSFSLLFSFFYQHGHSTIEVHNIYSYKNKFLRVKQHRVT